MSWTLPGWWLDSVAEGLPLGDSHDPPMWLGLASLALLCYLSLRHVAIGVSGWLLLVVL